MLDGVDSARAGFDGERRILKYVAGERRRAFERDRPGRRSFHFRVTGKMAGGSEVWRADLAALGGFTLTVLMTLALGLGGLTAVFCAMDRLLLQAVPYAEPDRLVALHETQLGKGYRPVSLANLMDWRAQSTSFLGMAGYMTRTFGLRGGSGEAGSAVSVIRTGMVTSELFPVLGLRPEQGRTFSEQEERAGSGLSF